MKGSLFGFVEVPGDNPPKKLRTSKLDGGLSASVNQKDADPSESSQMESVRFSQGGVERDFNLANLGDPHNKVLALHNHLTVGENGVINRTLALVVDDDGYPELMSWDGDQEVWESLGNVFSDTYELSGGKAKMSTILNTLIFTWPNDSIPVFYWNEEENEFSTIEGLSNRRDAVEYGNRAVYLGNYWNPENIVWAASGTILNIDPENYPGAGETNLVGGIDQDVDPIIGGANLGLNLAIFRERSIWRGYQTGNVDMALGFVRWLDGIGTRSQLAICSAGSGVLFFGSDKMPYFLSEAGIKPVGGKIYPYLRDVVDPDNLHLVESAYDKTDQLWYLAIPEGVGQEQNTCILTLDLGRFLGTGEVCWAYRSQPSERLGFTTTILPESQPIVAPTAYPEYDDAVPAGSYATISVVNHNYDGNEILEVWMSDDGGSNYYKSTEKPIFGSTTSVLVSSLRGSPLVPLTDYRVSLRYRRGGLYRSEYDTNPESNPSSPGLWPSISRGEFTTTIDPPTLVSGEWVRVSAEAEKISLTFTPAEGLEENDIKIYRDNVLLETLEGPFEGDVIYDDETIEGERMYSYTLSTVGGEGDSPESEPLEIWAGPPGIPSIAWVWVAGAGVRYEVGLGSWERTFHVEIHDNYNNAGGTNPDFDLRFTISPPNTGGISPDLQGVVGSVVISVTARYRVTNFGVDDYGQLGTGNYIKQVTVYEEE